MCFDGSLSAVTTYAGLVTAVTTCAGLVSVRAVIHGRCDGPISACLVATYIVSRAGDTHHYVLH